MGVPDCEQAAQAPSLLSQSVRAIHGWSDTGQSHVLKSLRPFRLTDILLGATGVGVVGVSTPSHVCEIAAISSTMKSEARVVS